jgi:hypothetical protein
MGCKSQEVDSVAKRFCVINDQLNDTITAIILRESIKKGKRVSYSKILNYLAVLGVEQYKRLSGPEGRTSDVKVPHFDFDRPIRRVRRP